MSKNVLIISTSPRNGGNSDTLCEQFRKGAEESGNRVEKIRLAELKIDYCSACYACNLLYCTNCGSKLWFHTNTTNKEIQYFSCSNYKTDTVKQGTMCGWTLSNR